MKNILSNVVVAVVSTAFTFFLFHNYYQPSPLVIEEERPVQLVSHRDDAFVNSPPREWSVNPPSDFTTVSEAATASVVNISTLSSTGYRISSGSGVIVSTDGYIITNHHVLEDGSTFQVTLYDKRKLEAELIGKDPSTDLALIKIKTGGLRPVVFGNSDQVRIGEWVLAVGNPFNLSSTVTAGIVSAKARNINILKSSYSIESFIQTDAVVNPGNSGGALVNSQGELIGINTAILSESGGYEGYSFAIPSNLVRKVIADLKEYREVRRAILGVGIQDVTDEIAADLKLPKVAGVYINNVNQGSSAAEAGLRTGDVLISVNGVETQSVPELQEQVALFRPGDRISVEYFRSGRRHKKEDVLLKGLDSMATSFR
jgi:serine protease Do